MAFTSSLVLLAVIWAMVFFIVLPLRLQTQGEAGEIVEGTHASAPVDFSFKRKARVVSLIAFPLWGITCAIILSGIITVDDFDMFKRLSPSTTLQDGGTNE